VATTVAGISQDWVLVALNALLVAITAVYAVLTWRLAKSSAAAADSAAEAARAAADSARSQRAAIEAEVNRRHAWFKTGGGGASYERWEIGIRPLVGAYVLRKVALLDFHFMPQVPNEAGVQAGVRVDVNRIMEPKGQALPMRVDEVEGAMFELDVAALAREAIPDDQWTILHWSCEVTFSLSEFAESERRVIVYSDPKMDPPLHWLREAGELGLG